jgi:hypothetical protein
MLEGPRRRGTSRQHDGGQQQRRETRHSMAHVAITPSRHKKIRMIR